MKLIRLPLAALAAAILATTCSVAMLSHPSPARADQDDQRAYRHHDRDAQPTWNNSGNRAWNNGRRPDRDDRHWNRARSNGSNGYNGYNGYNQYNAYNQYNGYNPGYANPGYYNPGYDNGRVVGNGYGNGWNGQYRYAHDNGNHNGWYKHRHRDRDRR